MITNRYFRFNRREGSEIKEGRIMMMMTMINECWSRYHTVFTTNFDRFSSPLCYFYCRNEINSLFLHTRFVCSFQDAVKFSISSLIEQTCHSREHKDALNNSFKKYWRFYLSHFSRLLGKMGINLS